MMKYFVFLLFLANFAHSMSDKKDHYYIVVQTTNFGSPWKEEFSFEEVERQLCGEQNKEQGIQIDDVLRPYYPSVLDGCRVDETTLNLNEITCAKKLAFNKSIDGSTYSELTLDISECRSVNNKNFRFAVYYATRLNLINERVPYPDVNLYVE
ncbi:MAG: hypothetical protein CL674_01400 [Bdellovibrionaceae bacterium]|nr:hypothetical protein [Pseudobdellovibrionaceae bacterium]|tara:strand:+ start:14429 stop:14887 length:459 start_codon:yes stop_codon:yes gene_type:complete